MLCKIRAAICDHIIKWLFDWWSLNFDTDTVSFVTINHREIPKVNDQNILRPRNSSKGSGDFVFTAICHKRYRFYLLTGFGFFLVFRFIVKSLSFTSEDSRGRKISEEKGEHVIIIATWKKEVIKFHSSAFPNLNISQRRKITQNILRMEPRENRATWRKKKKELVPILYCNDSLLTLGYWLLCCLLPHLENSLPQFRRFSSWSSFFSTIFTFNFKSLRCWEISRFYSK